MITLSVGVQYLGPSRNADFWDPKKTARDVHGKNGLIAGQDKAVSAAKKMHITGS